ncbi:MAG TPA: haloacid dehalogenase type II [Casimicrobiaceae bacterium]|jgi:2-haloacid dehalogenase|nr:haloacid dehalogenase type II [Casimicrobiaceae bacterium]
MEPIRALLFDVFGTLVDWRTAVAREVEAMAVRHGVSVDALAFADAWRAQYQPSMEAIRSGREPFCPLDALHRRNLDAILPQFGLGGLDATARAELNLAWHRLDAWPDAAPGLARLRRTFRLAPCSNGNVSLMVDLARRNDFPWDAILGAELARDYKPKPIVYLASAAAFGCAPEETMMVAAHTSDLVAAAALGLLTAFVARPDEFGAGRGGEARPGAPVDVAVASLTELADRLASGTPRSLNVPD